VKTPTATLVVLGFLLLGALRRLVRILKGIERPVSFELHRDEIVILSTFTLFIASAMGSGINIGLRHILLAYPLLFILAGRVTKFFEDWVSGRRWKAICASILVLLGSEVLRSSPHYLAFFNCISGGPENGMNILSDSNIDWGQDLKNLANYLEHQGHPELVLSYFGTAMPQYYGIQYQGLASSGWAYPSPEHLNSVDPKKEYLAISVTNLQATYFSNHQLFSWLKEKRPIAKIGYSIYVYDITEDLQSQEKLLEIYGRMGPAEKILKQETRIRRLREKIQLQKAQSAFGSHRTFANIVRI
jgi:hypothetical protein